MTKPKPTKGSKPRKLSRQPDPTLRFGEKFKAARLAHGSSQNQVARAVKANVTTVSRYEISDVQPSITMAVALARAVGASLDQLCGLAPADNELVLIARKLAGVLSDQQQQALAAHLRVVLALAEKK